MYHPDNGLLGSIFRNVINANIHLMLKQILIWVKNCPTLCRSDYNMAHEPLIYGWAKGAAHFFSGDYTLSSVVDDAPDIGKMDKKQLQTLISEMRNSTPSTVIRVDKPTRNTIHPTCKPVRLIERNIIASSRHREIVLDMFNGSGTCLIACRKTGRRYRGNEFAPGYTQATLQRYFEYCGEEPKLLQQDGSLVSFSEVKKNRESS